MVVAADVVVVGMGVGEVVVVAAVADDVDDGGVWAVGDEYVVVAFDVLGVAAPLVVGADGGGGG